MVHALPSATLETSGTPSSAAILLQLCQHFMKPTHSLPIAEALRGEAYQARILLGFLGYACWKVFRRHYRSGCCSSLQAYSYAKSNKEAQHGNDRRSEVMGIYACPSCTGSLSLGQGIKHRS